MTLDSGYLQENSWNEDVDVLMHSFGSFAFKQTTDGILLSFMLNNIRSYDALARRTEYSEC